MTLHKVYLTPKLVKVVIIHVDLPRTPGPDFNSVVVPKTCEPELSNILAELFNICLKESCFSDCGKISFVVPVFKNVGESKTKLKLPPC